MNATPSQLRLLADIIEKELEWEYAAQPEPVFDKWFPSCDAPNDLITMFQRGFAIRIKAAVFPEPPTGEEWHNPDNLTPEQVGVKDGWRLALKSEICPQSPLRGKCEGFNCDKIWEAGLWAANSKDVTYRTREPLPTWKLGSSINGFTLAEGQQWHRQDGWTQEMLGNIFRPLLLGEVEQAEDFYWHPARKRQPHPCASSTGAQPSDYHRFTARPLPTVIPDGFIAWNGGDKAPVSGKVEVIYRNRERGSAYAEDLGWDHTNVPYDIIAYRTLFAPWSCPEDVPGPICWLREKGFSDQHAGMVVYLFDHCLDIAGRGRKRYSELNKYEWSSDRKTWKECCK